MTHKEDIYDLLSEGPLTTSEITSTLGLDRHNTYNFLRYLEFWGKVERCGYIQGPGKRMVQWRRT